MSSINIKDLETAQGINEDDFVILEQYNGTRKVKARIFEDMSNQEIIQARGESDTLGDRLNLFDSNLSKKVYKGDIVLNVKDFGATPNSQTNQTALIQDVINYANSLSDNTTAGSKVSVLIPCGKYNVSNLKLKRNVRLYGDGVLNVVGEGNVGVILDNCLFSSLDFLTIKLNDANQTGIKLTTSDKSTSATQLNTFNCVVVDGSLVENTLSLDIEYAWVNTFYSCKFFRSSDGIRFSDLDSNANIFYNCEVRHSNKNANSNQAITHINGKNNMFIGGAIESYRSCADVQGGDFKLKGVYTEDFLVDRPFLLQGGSLTIDSCLLKGKFEIRGGDVLRIMNCDGIRGGLHTNETSPLIMFTENVDTRIRTVGNSLPKGTIITRYGQYYKNTWNRRNKFDQEEILDDKTLLSYGIEGKSLPITGDGTDSTIIFNKKMFDVFDEYNVETGIFTPKIGGIFKINVFVKLSGVSSTNNTLTLFIKESNGKSYRVDSNKSEARDNSNSVLLKGSAIFFIENTKNIRVSVKADGSSKNVSVDGGSGNNVWSSLSIERIQ